MAYTVAYQPELDGFTSFFSFVPELMIGMNNFMYSFKNGQIWKHYVNPLRGTFYGSSESSSIDICFNDAPNEIKLFKTLSFDGTENPESITAEMSTSMSGRLYTGEISNSNFDVKEGISYGYIRSVETAENTTYNQKGVGALSARGTSPFRYTVTTSSYVEPPAIGLDVLGFVSGTTGLYVEIGIIIGYSKSGNLHTFYTSAQANLPGYGEVLVVSKNITIDSGGLRGNNMLTTLTMTGTDPFEIFSASTDVMKSNP